MGIFPYRFFCLFPKSTEWCSIKQTLVFNTSQPFPNWFFSFFNRFIIVNLLVELKVTPGFVILTLGVIYLYLVTQVPTLVLFSVGIVFSINQSWKIHVQGKAPVNHSEKNAIIFKQRGYLSVLWNSLERAAFNKETFYLLFGHPQDTPASSILNWSLRFSNSYMVKLYECGF